MNKKQVIALFAIFVVVSLVGNSMGALLPVKAARLGANASVTGLYMAGVYIGLASGVLSAGWITDKLNRRKILLMAAGVLSGFMYWEMGRATSMRQFALLSIITTFLEGIQIAIINILAGLHAGPDERGRIFGILGSASPVGALVSGLSGTVVNRWGYTGFFTTAALVTLLQPFSALWFEEKSVGRLAQSHSAEPAQNPLSNRAFVFLFLASSLAFVGGGIFGLARSLGMAKSGFDAAAISSTVAVSGLITLPFPFVLGWLSDRAGRRSLLMVCYAAGAAGLFVLAIATQIWQFWVAAAFQAVMGASLGIGAALVTDMLSPDVLGSGLSLFSATMWIGSILGSIVAGSAIQRFGFAPSLLIGASLAAPSILFMILIRPNVIRAKIKAAVES